MLGFHATDKIGAIYSITNNENGKCYVGKSSNVFDRWRHHLKDLRRGVHNNVHLQRAWDKYGEKTFHFSILECVQEISDLGARELWYVTLLGTQNQDVGYNLNIVTTNSYQASAETRAKQSASQKLAWVKYRDQRIAYITPEYLEMQREIQTGKKASPETKAKMSVASKGKKKSPEHAAKLRAAHKGWVPSLETRAKIGAAHKGHKASAETKAKMSATRKGQKRGPYKRSSTENIQGEN